MTTFLRPIMILSTVGISLTFAGCSMTERTIGGAAVGGVGGALIGDAVAGTGGAIVGGVAGGLAGAAVGRNL